MGALLCNRSKSECRTTIGSNSTFLICCRIETARFGLLLPPVCIDAPPMAAARDTQSGMVCRNNLFRISLWIALVSSGPVPGAKVFSASCWTETAKRR